MMSKEPIKSLPQLNTLAKEISDTKFSGIPASFIPEIYDRTLIAEFEIHQDRDKDRFYIDQIQYFCISTNVPR